jgi:hypothetical protein
MVKDVMQIGSSNWKRAASAALLFAGLAGCTWVENGETDAALSARHVAADYQPLATCLHGELQLQEIGVLVAVDPAQQRARIWRELPEQTIAADEFDIDLAQVAPHDVEIRLREAGLDNAGRAFTSRLSPMIRRCIAQQAASASS